MDSPVFLSSYASDDQATHALNKTLSSRRGDPGTRAMQRRCAARQTLAASPAELRGANRQPQLQCAWKAVGRDET